MQRTIKAVIRPGEQSGYVAECVELPVITQGSTLDHTVDNLREAIELHVQDKDPALSASWRASVLRSYRNAAVMRNSDAQHPMDGGRR